MLVAGLFAGFVAGMFGIGGGFVVVPALAAVLTVLPHEGGDEHIMHVAIGTSLATIFFTSLRSVQAHAKRGAVDWNILKGWLPWVVGGVIARRGADQLHGWQPAEDRFRPVPDPARPAVRFPVFSAAR